MFPSKNIEENKQKITKKEFEAAIKMLDPENKRKSRYPARNVAPNLSAAKQRTINKNKISDSKIEGKNQITLVKKNTESDMKKNIEEKNLNLNKGITNLPTAGSYDKSELPETVNSEQKNRSRESSPADSATYEEQEKKSNRQPPIIAKSITSQQIIDLFKKNNQSINFVMKNSSDGCLIKTFTLDNFNKTVEQFKLLEIQFITFTNKNVKPKTILLKGLNLQSKEEDVLKELKEKQIENITITKISEFKSNSKSSKTFLLQLSSESIIKNLTHLKCLSHQIIKWEPLHKDGLSQCKRCQRLGHVATNCNMQYRCVKCIEEHGPGQCRVNGESIPVQCVLCKEIGHPASYKGCKFRIKEEQKNVQRSLKNNETKRRMYAEVLAAKSTTKSADAVQKSTMGTNSPSDTPLQNEDNDKSYFFQYFKKLDSKFDSFSSEMANFKKEMVEVSKNNYNEISLKVNQNSKKINTILNHLNLECKE